MTTRLVLALASWLAMAFAAAAQSSFQNLDFEGAHGPFTFNIRDPNLLTTEALPGWSVGGPGSAVYGAISHGWLSSGGPDVCLVDTNVITQFPVIAGSYSVGMGAGRDTVPEYQVPVWIAQTGTIPADALQLLFLSRTGTGSANLAVTFGGTLLPFQAVADLEGGVSQYEADVSTLAGRTAELRFTTLLLASGHNYVELDNIAFSAVPEPSVLWLLACGLAGGACVWRHESRTHAGREPPTRLVPRFSKEFQTHRGSARPVGVRRRAAS